MRLRTHLKFCDTQHSAIYLANLEWAQESELSLFHVD